MTVHREILWTVATVLVLLMIFGGADNAAAQAGIRHVKVWEVEPGTTLADLPTEFVEPACGHDGGPVGRILPSFDDFAQCPMEESTGLHEVAFQFDDLQEYVARALRSTSEASRFRANAIFGHLVRLSFLVGDEGRIQGFRVTTDERAELVERENAYTLAYNFKALFGNNDWVCEKAPPTEGETPMGGQFVKETCESTGEDRIVRIESHFYRKPGQSFRDPHTQKLTDGYFVSSTRLEILYPVDSLPDLVEADGDMERLQAPGSAAEPLAQFLAGDAIDCPDCDLAGADLRRRNLTGANLSGANLKDAILHRAVLRQADLTGADLSKANLNRADLSLASLRDANLSEALLYDVYAARADFSGANLFYVWAGKARLTLANFDNANLELADLGEALLNDATLIGANLAKAYLQHATLVRADLGGAVATGAVFARAGLHQANLTGANLSGSDLFDADLSGADLSGADLSNSRLWSANLFNTIQEGTLFEGTIMPGDDVDP